VIPTNIVLLQMTFGEGDQLKSWVLNPLVQQLLQQAKGLLNQGMPDEELSHMMATWLKVCKCSRHSRQPELGDCTSAPVL
jgi:hypothetical protein